MTPTPTSTGRTWSLHASSSRGTYWHVGAKRWVELHGLDYPVVPVIVEERLGNARDPEVTHYGWEKTDRPGEITMIWPRTRGRAELAPWLSLDMGFPYGMKAAIDAGEGKMVALRITPSTT